MSHSKKLGISNSNVRIQKLIEAVSHSKKLGISNNELNIRNYEEAVSHSKKLGISNVSTAHVSNLPAANHSDGSTDPLNDEHKETEAADFRFLVLISGEEVYDLPP